MKNKIIPVIIVVLILAGIGGFFALKGKKAKTQNAQSTETVSEDIYVPIDPAVTATVTRSKTKDNTVVLTVAGMGGKYTSVTYELSYDSMGIIQGVTSRPVEVSGQDTFTRDDIYLGTCSKNVCRPHQGVKKISITLEFKNTAGKKSQFSKDFDI